MIDLKDCRERLGQLPLFLSVKDTISAADAMETFNAVPPAAFISVASERAQPNAMATGRRRQRVSTTLSILFALGTERADQDQADPAEEARQAIIAQLVGWRAEGADGAFDYVGYSIIQISDGLLWGEVLIAAPWHLIS